MFDGSEVQEFIVHMERILDGYQDGIHAQSNPHAAAFALRLKQLRDELIERRAHDPQ